MFQLFDHPFFINLSPGVPPVSLARDFALLRTPHHRVKAAVRDAERVAALAAKSQAVSPALALAPTKKTRMRVVSPHTRRKMAVLSHTLAKLLYYGV